MRSTARVTSASRRAATWLQRQRDALGLSPGGIVALAAAVVAFVTAVVVLGGVSEDVTQHNGLAKHDLADLRIFTDHRSAVLVRAAHIATTLGTVTIVALVAIIAGLLLWRLGLPLVLAAAPAFSLAVAAVLAEIGKQLVDRGRPPASIRLASETDASFPSGHATNSAALYVTLGLVIAVFVFRRPLARVMIVVAFGLLTAVIGASRLELGLHWPTDVLAGWALGTTVALAVTIGVALIAQCKPADPSQPSGRLRRAGARLH
jgi:undecaprenyl-diphosphatase